jgi:hypothetical protein
LSAAGEEILDVLLDGNLLEQVGKVLGHDISTDDLVMLGDQGAVRQLHITRADNSDFHRMPPFAEFISSFKVSISA